MITQAAADILNKYFDKVLILTIQRNEKRRELLKDILKDLNYEIFFGVEGGKLVLTDLINSGVVSPDIDAIYKKANIDYMNMGSKPIHINQIACSLSHLEMFKYVTKNNLSRVLILEDDIVPVEENLRYLSNTLEQVPDSWDILYLGHIINNDFSFLGQLKYHYFVNLLHAGGIKTDAIVRKKNTYPAPHSSLLKKQGAHIGTHAYAVSNLGAQKLLALEQPLRQSAPDLLLMDAIAKRKVVSYTSTYNFFIQNPEIHSSVWDGQVKSSITNG